VSAQAVAEGRRVRRGPLNKREAASEAQVQKGGIRDLLADVIRSALDDYDHGPGRDPKAPRWHYYHSAERFFFSPESHLPWMAAGLELDEDVVRMRVDAKRAAEYERLRERVA
jgi:hypothetical protein